MCNVQTARTTSVCRVLVINRLDYVALVGSFPISAKAVMDNLADRAEEVRAMEQLYRLCSHVGTPHNKDSFHCDSVQVHRCCMTQHALVVGCPKPSSSIQLMTVPCCICCCAPQMVRDEFPGPASEEILKDLDALAALSLKWASPELMGEPDKKRQLLRRSSGSRQQLVLVDEDTLTGGALSRQGTAPDARTGDGAQGPGEGSCCNHVMASLGGSSAECHTTPHTGLWMTIVLGCLPVPFAGRATHGLSAQPAHVCLPHPSP